MMRIDRCLCYERTFSELKAVAEEHNCSTLWDLQEHARFGRNCRLCHPYVKEMLRTGETVFYRVISQDEDSR
jgi:bacterioferritin-associated ferredoxin